MMTIEFIRHAECSEELLINICRFKNLNWSYPIESHRRWIDNNLTEGDIHILLKDNDKLIGYLNIVNVSIQCDGETLYVLGIGNVCIHPDNKCLGLGALIMSAAKYYCRRNNRVGVLLCQDKNKAFYDACNWYRFNGTVYQSNYGSSKHINFYSTKPLLYKVVNCNREF